jgi:hypothetical protein
MHPSKSGLMNKHIVKHIVTYRVAFNGSAFLFSLVPWYPSNKSGLLNEHIVNISRTGRCWFGISRGTNIS